jgi:hypothetical protein
MAVCYRRLAATLALVAVVATLGLAAPARATTTVLYTGSLNGQTLGDQGYFEYATSDSPSASTTTFYASGGTVLRSTTADSAGYYTTLGTLPDLSRTAGYTLTFTARVVSEAHQNNDRAGFSVLLLGDDNRGIELAFWQNEVWAQRDGVNDPTAGGGRWTHGESAVYNTSVGLVTYSVVVKGSTYRVLANGAQILSGPVRRYEVTDLEIALNPARRVYRGTNLIFLGDNSGRANAEAHVTGVELELATEGVTPSPSPSASPTTRPPDLTPAAYLPVIAR